MALKSTEVQVAEMLLGKVACPVCGKEAEQRKPFPHDSNTSDGFKKIHFFCVQLRCSMYYFDREGRRLSGVAT